MGVNYQGKEEDKSVREDSFRRYQNVFSEDGKTKIRPWFLSQDSGLCKYLYFLFTTGWHLNML